MEEKKRVRDRSSSLELKLSEGLKRKYAKEEKQTKKERVNKGLLANLLKQNVRNNERMDLKEVEKARWKLGEIDKEGKLEVKLMSAFLSEKKLREKEGKIE